MCNVPRWHTVIIHFVHWGMEGKMRLKSVVKYNISGMKYSILIFYGIIVAVMVFLVVSMGVIMVKSNSVNFVGGAEMASAIFLFVAGLNCFKQNYLFLSTNGITRKAQFYGFIFSSLPIVAVMGAIDTAYGNILSEFINYNSMFSQIYRGFALETSRLLIILTGFVWSVALYLFAMLLGYFITTLYYRMSKMLKIIVSVGVPVLFIYVLPAIDAVANNGKIYGWIGKLFLSLGGLRNGYNPLIGIISLLIGSAILAGLAFLLVRKAPVKQ